MKKKKQEETMAFPFDTSISYWIYRIRSRADAALRRAFQESGHDMTPEQWNVLARIREVEGMNQCQLGDKVLKDRHNMTRILNRLEKKGLIERQRCSDDRRSFRLYATDAGRTVERELTAVALKQRDYRYKGMSKQEIELLRGLLEQIFINIEEYLAVKK